MPERWNENLDPRAHWSRLTIRQPHWVTRVALATGLLILAIPLAILLMVAITVGLLVFTILGLTARLVEAVGRSAGRTGSGQKADDGRRNVRVIHSNHD